MIKKSNVTILLLVSMLLSLNSNALAKKGDRREGREGRENRNERQDRGNNRERNNWREYYVGNPSFKLIDDRRLRKMIKNVNRIDSELATVNNQINAIQKEIDKIKKGIEVNRKKVKELNGVEKKLLTKKDKLQTQIISATGKITSLTKKIVQDQKAVNMAEVEMKKAQAQQKTAKQSVTSAELTLAKTKAELEKAQAAGNTVKIEKLTRMIEKQTQNLESLNGLLNLATEQTKTKQAALKVAKSTLQKDKKQKETLTNNIPKWKDEVIAIGNQRDANRNEIAKVNKSINVQKKQIKNENTKKNPLDNKSSKLSTALNDASKQRNRYRTNLIDRILEINSYGADQGTNAGDSDGFYISDQQGKLYGNQDGQRDGEDLGRNRDYGLGETEGRKVGLKRAETDGEVDGTREGKKRGNEEAATREGTNAGGIRADNSNADTVGTGQGNDAGMTRAINTGNNIGTPQGENQAIEEREGQTLSNKEIQGDFAGTFSRNTPDYPGPSHNSYNTSESNKFVRNVVRLAYLDGYETSYLNRSRTTYYNTISQNYNDAYDRSERESLDQFYQDSFDQGHSYGDDAAYNDNYQSFRRQYYESARIYNEMNPDRGSSEYKSTYDFSEKNAFDKEYERIRRENYNTAENRTFDANIAAQTKKFRLKRHSEVSNIYDNFAVLKFVSRSLIDSGIHGIAKKDGVFQPGESIVSNVTLINYGKKSANNVTIEIDGSNVVISNISPLSTTTIVGAVKSNLPNANIGDRVKTNMTMNYSLKSQDKRIEGRNFESIGSNTVGTERQSIKISYPLNVSNLTTNGQLILNEQNGLGITVDNNSNRAYTGPINIEIDVNSSNNVMTKNFSTVMNINRSGNANLNDAEVNITDDRDLYRHLFFRVTISKNGVTLGILENPLSAMVKAEFIDRGDAPVLIVNSDQTTNDLLDIVSELGGPTEVSVLDTSLRQRNKTHLENGLDNKTIMVLDPGDGSISLNLGAVVHMSTNSSFLAISEENNGLSMIERLSQFNDSTKLEMKISNIGEKVRVVETNEHMIKNLRSSSTVMEANMSNYASMLPVITLMKMNTKDHINLVRKNIDRNRFFNTNVEETQLIQSLNIKMLEEIMRFNTAYKKSKGGIFGWGHDDKWLEMMKNDKSLIINQLNEMVKNESINESNANLFLLAKASVFTLDNGLNAYRPLKDEVHSSISRVVEKVRREMNRIANEQLTQYDRDLHRRAVTNNSYYTPFKPGTHETIEDPWR